MSDAIHVTLLNSDPKTGESFNSARLWGRVVETGKVYEQPGPSIGGIVLELVKDYPIETVVEFQHECSENPSFEPTTLEHWLEIIRVRKFPYSDQQKQQAIEALARARQAPAA